CPARLSRGSVLARQHARRQGRRHPLLRVGLRPQVPARPARGEGRRPSRLRRRDDLSLGQGGSETQVSVHRERRRFERRNRAGQRRCAGLPRHVVPIGRKDPDLSQPLDEERRRRLRRGHGVQAARRRLGRRLGRAHAQAGGGEVASIGPCRGDDRTRAVARPARARESALAWRAPARSNAPMDRRRFLREGALTGATLIGGAVTIYAQALPPDTTSNIAGGQWLPYLVADADRRSDAFNRQFDEASRYAHRRYQLLVGPRYGVRWLRNYFLSHRAFRDDGLLGAQSPLGDLIPERRVLGPAEHPFTGFEYVRQIDTMFVEPSVYLPAMMEAFQVAGGR